MSPACPAVCVVFESSAVWVAPSGKASWLPRVAPCPCAGLVWSDAWPAPAPAWLRVAAVSVVFLLFSGWSDPRCWWMLGITPNRPIRKIAIKIAITLRLGDAPSESMGQSPYFGVLKLCRAFLGSTEYTRKSCDCQILTARFQSQWAKPVSEQPQDA